jgi:C-terminal processing protease CtpA/Prc
MKRLSPGFLSIMTYGSLTMTRLSVLIALVFGTACSAGAQVPGQLRNPSFEEATADGAPSGWSAGSSGYRAEVVVGEGVDGGSAMRLRRLPGDAGGNLGTVLQAVDATAFRGKRVRLRAHARATPFGPGSWAGVWLREDLAGGGMGFFDNMQDRSIRSDEWREHEIVGDIGPNAERLVLGLLLAGQGTAWLDNVSLEILGDSPPRLVEPPRALSPRGIDNLVAFSRLLGYVRYFHPGDHAAAANWEWVAVAGVRRIEAATDAAALASALASVFTPLAPGLVVSVGAPAPQATRREGPVPAGSEAMAWRHQGLGIGVAPQHAYLSERVRLPATDSRFGDALPAIGERYVADLGGGVYASVPLTVLVDDEPQAAGAQRPGHPADPLPTTGAFTAEDRATRLAAVALGWTLFQHFYPYFDVVAADWPAELRRALESAATDADALAFLVTLRRMVAALEDGHGVVSHGAEGHTSTPDINWADADGQVVITVASDGAGVRPGDVVHRINGRPADDVLGEVEQLISGATPQWRRHRALRAILAGPPDSELLLEVHGSDGAQRNVALRRTRGTPLAEPRPEPVAEVRPGILYVDIDRVTDQQFADALPRLAAADGLIFDVRGYPSQNAIRIISHLLAAPGTSAQWHVPLVTRPDRTDMGFSRGGEWDLQPAQPHLGAPRVFITDGRAMSYAESIMGIVEHYRLGEIVGEATAGTNGNINPFTLPGGYRVSWTGMKVLKHDGSVHHGIGILPTVPVQRTVRGIAAGRDELLERALELLGQSAFRR